VSQILEVLGKQELSVSEWMHQCGAALDTSDRTFKQLKAVALKQGLIEQRAEGRNKLVKQAEKPTGAKNGGAIPAHENLLFKGA
jgi:hypothetical protein